MNMISMVVRSNRVTNSLRNHRIEQWLNGEIESSAFEYQINVIVRLPLK